MVFLVKKVQKEKLIMEALNLNYFIEKVVTNCIRICEEESYAACISYVRKGKLKQATKMLKETIQCMKRDGELINKRGRLYHVVLQEALGIGPYDKVDQVERFFMYKDGPHILPEDPKHNDDWSKRCLQDLTIVLDYFVNLFAKDEAFIDELTFDWMKEKKCAYLLLCMWEYHMREKRDAESRLSRTKRPTLVISTGKKGESVPESDESRDMEVVMYAFHVAVLLNSVDIVENLFFQRWPDFDVNAKSFKGETALHINARTGCEPMLRYLLTHDKLDINAQTRKPRNGGPDVAHKTALHITCEHGYANLVDLLCLDEKHKKVLRCHEEDADNMTALDVVYEKLRTEVWVECCLQHKEQQCATCHASYEDIEKTRLSVDAVKTGVEILYRNRQELVDAANAILVGAALIASVTFAGWLQPPLGYAQYYEYPIPDPAPPGTYGSYLGDNVGIQIFAIFNSLSFFFATATVIVGADAAFPIDRCRKIHVHTGHVVKAMKFLLRRAIKFLMASVVCVLGAFGSAAVVILPPHVYFRRHLVATIFTGGGLCGVMLWQLFTRHSATVRQLNAWIRSVIYEYTNLFSLPPFLVRFMKEDEND